MIYLTNRNRKVKEKYGLLLNRMTLIASQTKSSINLNELSKGTLLNYDDIKKLEVELQKLETIAQLAPSKFISNTFNSRWKQLEFIEHKLRAVEKAVKSQTFTA